MTRWTPGRKTWARIIRVEITDEDRHALGWWRDESSGPTTIRAVVRFVERNGMNELERIVERYRRRGQ